MFKHTFNETILRSYDIRGIYEKTLTQKDAFMLGFFFGITIKKKYPEKKHPLIVVGMDGRLSSPFLEEKLTEGLENSGCEIYRIGLGPTPMLYFASNYYKADGAIQVTGSHNPKNYNGLKIVLNDEPVSGKEIFNLINEEIKLPLLNAKSEEIDIIDEYIDEVCKNIFIKTRIKVVLDSGNGAAGCVAPKLFKKLGCDVIELFSEIDGNFPNHHPDPGKIENLQDLVKSVRENNADLGIAFDGDGDRLGVVTEKGDIIFPDKIMMLFSKEVLKRKKGKVIYDVKCSKDLEYIIKKYNGEPVMSPTGHFHIKNAIKETKAILAGEMSGHIFFNDIWYGFDDGHYAGARMVEIISNSSRNISSIIDDFPKSYSTPELNISVTDDTKFQIIKKFTEECEIKGDKISIDGLRINFKNGWGLIRASNTSPNLVLRFEGSSENDLNIIKDEFISELSRICPDVDILIN